MAAQQARRRKWAADEVEETMEIRRAVKAKAEKRSDSALKVVLLVWALVCAAIFFHVWTTIQRGAHHQLAQAADDGFDANLQASDQILKAFRQQRDQQMS